MCCVSCAAGLAGVTFPDAWKHQTPSQPSDSTERDGQTPWTEREPFQVSIQALLSPEVWGLNSLGGVFLRMH